MEVLYLSSNELTGPIPPALGATGSLRHLDLALNELTGPIPPELGQLSSLTLLYLGGNELSGAIPSALADLSALEQLSVSRNRLTGPIPPWLGEFPGLQRLWLHSNGFTGPIPPELGSLSGLEVLSVEANNLAGTVPPELGQLAELSVLGLSNNDGLTGALPSALTALGALEELLAGGTGLCAPADEDFQEWLAGIHKLRLARCNPETGSTAYLTQAVQSRDFPVPLLADKEALLRVFPMAARANSERLPPVRATFYIDGAQVHVADIADKPGPIPTTFVEGDLGLSSNATVPAEVLRPGLEAVIEIDPDGTLDPALGVGARIPEAGRLAIDVRAMPVLNLTLVPLIWESSPEREVVGLISEMAADPLGHELLADTRTLLPVTGIAVEEHAPVTTSTNDTSRLLAEIRAIWLLENGTGHYMGIMARFEEWGGRAYRPGRVSVSVPNGSTIAHELGHNMSLRHAPCGGPESLDPSYPYRAGQIGAWGFDASRGRLLSPSVSDLMSYCDANWISDYHLTNATGFRLRDEAVDSAGAAAAPAPTRSLLLWGGADPGGTPYLETAFVVDAAPALPESGGDYRLTGQATDGRELFALDFAMPEVADGDGGASFVFALPVRAEWEGGLAAITLVGPGGTATMDRDTDLPMVILRDSRTGQVRALLRGARPEALGPAGAAGDLIAGAELSVLSSRGIPDRDAWR